jgi:hypothetical protein
MGSAATINWTDGRAPRDLFGWNHGDVDSVLGRRAVIPAEMTTATTDTVLALAAVTCRCWHSIEAEIQRQYRVRLVGRLAEIRERYYAITVERRLRQPALVAIAERARRMFE